VGLKDLEAAEFKRRIAECQPFVIRGLVADWPCVRADSLTDYLKRFATAAPIEVFFGNAAIAGKYYYAPDLEGFNFERRTLALTDALHAIVSAGSSRSIYVGSVPAADYFPGFSNDNHLPLAQGPARLWLGTASNVSSHYDTLDNLACVIAGRRRFTLYSPLLISKLYVGPIDNTMAGQPVSLAASGHPGTFPLFEEIRDQALTFELGPGDALYLPKLWWHQVEGLEPCNALVNYWWDAFSAGPDAPYTALLLSMITMAERPLPERQAWRAFFDHYVFRTSGHPLAHLPVEKHGLLGPLKENYSKLRARILYMLRSRQ
jgi:hypothetical protein